MKVALLGAGRIGRLHARLLTATEGIDAVVIGDVDAERAAEVASSVGATVAPSMDAALEAADAVVIAAATGAHAELIRASIAFGSPAKTATRDRKSTRLNSSHPVLSRMPSSA